MRFLPRAASHLNPAESLWRFAKGQLPANAPTQKVEASLGVVERSLLELSSGDRLRLAGVAAQRFWLRKAIAAP